MKKTEMNSEKIIKFPSSEIIYVGIDPGREGAIVGRTKSEVVMKHRFPVISDEIDLWGIQEIFKAYLNAENTLYVVLEDVHSIFGVSAKANFQFGRAVGIIEAILVANNITFTKVHPKKWQTVLFQGIPEKRKPNKVEGKKGSLDTKPMALLAAKRLYPSLDLRGSERSKNPHEGIVDALCMSHYCFLHYTKK